MRKPATKTTHILLPSFLRRVHKAYALKAKIRSVGCQLNRIGRSRNWRLEASSQQLNDVRLMIESSGEDSWLWLSKKLKQENDKLTHDTILAIAHMNPGITVNELIAKTDCTVSEARQIIDELEWMYDD